MTAEQIQPSENDTQILALIALDEDFAPILENYGPPPSRRRPQEFATLLQIIVGQQVSTASAAAIWQRLTAGIKPQTPEILLAAGEEGLRAVGFSGPKIRYARALAEDLVSGRLNLSKLKDLDDEAVVEELTKVKGIGRWTAEIYLLSALGRTDIWPAADIALMTAAQELKGLPERPKADQLRELALAWRPYRTIAARMLWHYYGMKRGRSGAPLEEK